MSLQLYLIDGKHQQQDEFAQFEQLAENRLIAIEQSLDHSFSALFSLHAFYKSSRFVSRAEFSSFSKALLSQYPEIQALEWIPIVPLSERQKFEQHAKDEDVTRITFGELDEDGSLITATDKPIYYPVYYIEPLVGNEKALGFDLGSNADRLNLIRQATQEHRVVISAPIQLVQSTQQEPAILVLLPIFKKTVIAEEDQPSSTHILGYVSMVLKINKILRSAIDTELQYLDVKIRDKQTNTSLASSPQQKQANISNRYQKELPLTIGGREWSVLIAAPHQFLIKDNPQSLFLLFGFLISFILALYVHTIKRQYDIINREVLTRTNELKESQLQYRSVVETAVDSIISINKVGIVSQFNFSAEQLFGYTAAEVIGHNVLMLMGDDHAPKHDGYLAHYLETGVKKIIGTSREVMAKHKNGRLIPVHLSVSDTGYDGDMRFTGIIRDLTEINAAKESLHQNRLHLEETIKERTEELINANAELKKLSEIDPLTMVANRRVYDESLIKEVAAAKRSKQSLAFMMIDIDYFKQYNDTYGHDAGDKALQRVAATIREALPRKTDIVARFGGEEFVVLMPATDSEGAYIVANHIRENVKELALEHRHGTSSNVVTVSIGLTSLEGEALIDADLLNFADSALYRAKENGRDQCQIHEES